MRSSTTLPWRRKIPAVPSTVAGSWNCGRPIDRDDDVLGTRARKSSTCSVDSEDRWGCTGCNSNQAGALGASRGHRLEVVLARGGQRHGHGGAAVGADEDRVRLEGAPGEDDLVPLADHRAH